VTALCGFHAERACRASSDATVLCRPSRRHCAILALVEDPGIQALAADAMVCLLGIGRGDAIRRLDFQDAAGAVLDEISTILGERNGEQWFDHAAGSRSASSPATAASTVPWLTTCGVSSTPVN
jgi:hypothetical protein